MEALFELFESLPRQGPGSDASTRRALAALPRLPATPRILDLGCGSGRQSVVLALETGGFVDAVDRHEPFLRNVMDNARKAGVAEHVQTRCESIEAFEASAESYDLVWSEGALYAVGLERGLDLAYKRLKPRGLLAFTEASWLTSNPPLAARSFWAAAYPGMARVDQNRAKAERAGFRVLDSFILPAEDWRSEYYSPLRDRIEELREQSFARTDLALAIAEVEDEIAVFERHGDCYGYVFYLLQKT